MLPVDSVLEGPIFVGSSHKENVRQIHLWTNDECAVNARNKHSIEREFCGRQEIVSLPIRQFVRRLRRASNTDTEQLQNCGQASLRF